MSTIPASKYVGLTPSVLSAGGAALNFNSLVLTKSTRVPIGTIAQFPTALAVAKYFGANTNEANFATIYFNGFKGSTKKPGNILFAQKNGANVAAYLRGGSIVGQGLAWLQASTGTLTLTVNGTPITSSSINLSSATSFSNAATLIQAAFTSPPFTVTFDSISGAFVFTTTTTGPSATITDASSGNNLASRLELTLTTGAVISQGAAPASSENAFMNAIVLMSQNWVTFSSVYDPDQGVGNTSKQNFANWTNGQGGRYIYVPWDQDTSPATTDPATSSLTYLLTQSSSIGTAAVWGTDFTKAAFLCGAIASLDFSRKNGRANFAYLSQDGLVPDVTDIVTADNLEANGYNYYGAVATANQGFQFLYPGSITGEFAWVDSQVCNIWMNDSFQLDLLTFLTTIKSFPYNAAGYALLRQACMGTIKKALNFGAIRPGVPLSDEQIAAVNNAAGVDIDTVLSTQGWYLQILPASPDVRAARGTPPMTFWYMDGGSVNSLNLASVMAQ